MAPEEVVMSKKDVKEVISRLAAYHDFRQLLAVKPNLALRSYDLTAEEKDALQDIANSSFHLNIDERGDIQLVS